jgi:3-hydroxyisobutyrate dehydrogenase
MKIGFIGTGVMGTPMAKNLLKSNISLVVWNRTKSKLKPLLDMGAVQAENIDAIFDRVEYVILMLQNVKAIDEVLGRHLPIFASRVADHTIINMATISAENSKKLGEDIAAHGGRFVEAPVSGSKRPAEEGSLVAMLAGEDSDIERIKPIVERMCSSTLHCGAVPKAILMKLSINNLLINMVTGLAEAFNFASANGLDTNQFMDVLLAGPMANDIIRVKGPKLLNHNLDTQASIENVLDNNRLVVEAARTAGIHAPLINTCLQLYESIFNPLFPIMWAVHFCTEHSLAETKTRF